MTKAQLTAGAVALESHAAKLTRMTKDDWRNGRRDEALKTATLQVLVQILGETLRAMANATRD